MAREILRTDGAPSSPLSAQGVKASETIHLSARSEMTDRPPVGTARFREFLRARRAGVEDGPAHGGAGGLRVDEIRVFLVDDHRVVRTGLAAYLGVEPGMRVVGQAADGRAALDEIAVLDRAGELPDVVLMDLKMPRMDGIAATTEVKRRWPETEVVAVTSFVEEEQIRAALEAGAAGYLLKDADAAGGGCGDPGRDRRRGAPGPGRSARTDRVAACPAQEQAPLTPREREVVVAIASGATNRQIARELGVSERTARTHVSNILAKLGLTSRTQAAMWAVREGLVDEPERPTR